MALSYSWLQLIERIKRHVNNDWPNESFSPSDNEMLLYINEAMSSGLIGQVYGGAKVIGSFDVPEAYMVTFELATATLNPVSNKWETTLPQPPLSLPLGYSINRVYPADTSHWEGQDVIFLKNKRIGRRRDMPLQSGIYGSIYASTLSLWASNNISLNNIVFYAEMPSTRAVNINDPINLPDDAQEMIVTKVLARIKDRMMMPQDIIQDDLSQGNKSS